MTTHALELLFETKPDLRLSCSSLVGSGFSNRAALAADAEACLRILGPGFERDVAEAMAGHLVDLRDGGHRASYADHHKQFLVSHTEEILTPLENLLSADTIARCLYNSIAKDQDAVGTVIYDLSSLFKLFGFEAFETHGNEFIDYLTRVQISMMKDRISPGAKSVAFFCPTRAFRGHFGQIPELLERLGYAVFYFYGEQHDDDFEAHPTSFFIGGNMVTRLDFIDAFIVSSIMDCLPEQSKKILLDHLSFAVFTPTEMNNHRISAAISSDTNGGPKSYDDLVDIYTHAVAFFPLFDGFIVPTKITLDMAEARAEFFGGQRIGDAHAPCPAHPASADAEILLAGHSGKRLPSRQFIIPGGYPKLDSNIRTASRKAAPEKIITYAPTPNVTQAIKGAWLDFMSINHSGGAIVTGLAEAFPDYKIVFKPYADEFPEVVEAVVEAGRSYPNFSLDESGSQYLELYSNTAVLVSDLSSTAFSFSMMTLRPVLFYSVNEAKLLDLVATKGGDSYCESREKIGMIATSISEMIEHIRYMLANLPDFAERIGNVRAENCYNVGCSEEYIANNLYSFFEEKTRPDWTYYEYPSI